MVLEVLDGVVSPNIFTYYDDAGRLATTFAGYALLNAIALFLPKFACVLSN